MAEKTDTAPKPLTKAQWEKIGSDAAKLADQLTALADSIETEGVSPKLSQKIAYQRGMVNYAVRQLGDLQESAAEAAKQRGRKTKKS